MDLRYFFTDWGGTLMSEAGPAQRPMARWPEVVAVPGAKEMLGRIARACPVAVATNASVSHPDDVRQALARVGLAEHITDVFCVTSIGFRKDQAQFWDAVFDRIQVPRQATWMLGDSLSQDVFAPRRFGVRSIWFNPTGFDPAEARGAPVVSRLDQVTALIGLDRASTD